MRLIDTLTFVIRTFVGDDVPPYAILSHTWDRTELTLPDMMDDGFECKEGFRKIELCCAQAREDGFRYAWIDTCCIDKTSSAELSEAINSMYRWYKKSSICYAFLSDVDGCMPHESDPLLKSRWFTRSWTLQELLAPEIVVFYDRNWIQLGTASSLANRLTAVTGIPLSLFLSKVELTIHCVANKLSWAAKRQATRVEDRAYSLLGLFGVNMPLLYGEGDRAFERLQRKIIKSTNDLSIFAWSKPATGPEVEAPEISWLLATSLDDYGHLGPLVKSRIFPQESADLSVSLTANSMKIELPLYLDESNNKEALAFLGYKLAHEEKHLCVRLFADDSTGSSFARHQEISFLEKDEMYIREAFKPEEIRLSSFQQVLFLERDSQGGRSTGLLPFHMRMPNLYLSVSGDSIPGRLQARLRYIIDRQTGPPRQLLCESIPRLTYAIVSSNGPNWQKFTDIAIANLTMDLVDADGIFVILLPHLEEMRFYIATVSTIMVVEISLDDTVMVEMAIGMQMSDYGPQVYIRDVPTQVRGDIPSIWNLYAPERNAFDKVCADGRNIHTNKSFRIQGTVRPMGCSLPHHQYVEQCGCRSRRVDIHVQGDDHGLEEPSDAPQRRRSRRIRKLKPAVIETAPVSLRGSRRVEKLLNIQPIWLPNCHEKGYPKPGETGWSIEMGL